MPLNLRHKILKPPFPVFVFPQVKYSDLKLSTNLLTIAAGKKKLKLEEIFTEWAHVLKGLSMGKTWEVGEPMKEHEHDYQECVLQVIN